MEPVSQRSRVRLCPAASPVRSPPPERDGPSRGATWTGPCPEHVPGTDPPKASSGRDGSAPRCPLPSAEVLEKMVQPEVEGLRGPESPGHSPKGEQGTVAVVHEGEMTRCYKARTPQTHITLRGSPAPHTACRTPHAAHRTPSPLCTPP